MILAHEKSPICGQNLKNITNQLGCLCLEYGLCSTYALRIFITLGGLKKLKNQSLGTSFTNSSMLLMVFIFLMSSHSNSLYFPTCYIFSIYLYISVPSKAEFKKYCLVRHSLVTYSFLSKLNSRVYECSSSYLSVSFYSTGFAGICHVFDVIFLRFHLAFGSSLDGSLHQ